MGRVTCTATYPLGEMATRSTSDRRYASTQRKGRLFGDDLVAVLESAPGTRSVAASTAPQRSIVRRVGIEMKINEWPNHPTAS